MKFRILLLLPLLGVFGVSAFEVNQVFREERFTRGNVNLRPLQEIDNASWIWPDGVVYGGDSRPVVRFRAEFEGRQEQRVRTRTRISGISFFIEVSP